MELTICAFNSDLAEAKKMLKDNQTLFDLGAQLSKLNSINQQSPSLAADQVYDMYQSVVPKSSPDVISIVCGLIVCGLLVIFGINKNKIIYGIMNGIPSLSILRLVVNKSREDAFMRITWFVCKYPFSVLCDKVDCSRIDRLVKSIDF